MYSAAILAGGRATRFDGRDKSRLDVDGATILERQLAAFAAVRSIDEVLLVGGRAPYPGVRDVADAVPGCGPLGGIHTALVEARHPIVFVAACDMPFLSAAFIAHLLALAADADFVMPRTDDGDHPLCAVYARACLEPIARRLARRQLKVSELAGDVRTRLVEGNELDRFGDRHRLLANVNTPVDFAALHEHQL